MSFIYDDSEFQDGVVMLKVSLVSKSHTIL